MRTFTIENELYSKTISGRILGGLQAVMFGSIGVCCLSLFWVIPGILLPDTYSLQHLYTTTLSHLIYGFTYFGVVFVMGIVCGSISAPKSVLEKFSEQNSERVKNVTAEKIKLLELELELSRDEIFYRWRLETEIRLLKEEYLPRPKSLLQILISHALNPL